ncbi:universal stress protein [Roseospira marina]|uniref:Universal stress protein n=1 Tax=Roseospira marina TaxID=140057 RepID=A0A5M6IFV2_9PROT|nr:universal stress protein [Roseospira marina]KAA5606629.1 universal stress protein [Roseospira marina]MBB4313966.1 nucleotide-binding universal stress UspA family protein [Roseospira marina]MBB5087128.1 nucleotide-binding universal stress UspA family protein [Roseospira marina]
MPGIKTILAIVSSADSGRAPMDTAFLTGAALGAHVEVFHVRPDPASAVPYVGEAMAGALVEEMMAAAERDAKARADALKAMFDEIVQARAVELRDGPPPLDVLTAHWIVMDGNEPEEVAARGRVSDLIVAGRPGPNRELPSLITLNAALMEAGRAVLVAPPSPPTSVGTRVAIAWNGSPEAGRAVQAAMPLIARAEGVTILAAGDSEALCGPEDLSRHLAWHGVSPEIRTVKGHHGEDVGRTLLGHCADTGTDLLVMGAYTHSRLRQLIMGGVTRYILDHADIPVLLTH